MIKDLTKGQKLLADYMSEISERCYYAGWMGNVEYVLWSTLISGPRKYGHDLITEYDIDLLKKYSDESKSWIIFDDDTEETALNLKEWEMKFQLAIENDPAVLNG